MRTTLIVGVILAAASGSALAQGFGTPPKPSAKPPVAAKPPQAAVKPASTPESRSAAQLALSSDPVFDEGTFQRIKEALLIYSEIQVRGGWPTLPADAKLAPGASGPDVALLRQRLAITDDMAADRKPARPTTRPWSRASSISRLRHGLDATGTRRGADLDALNVPVGKRIKQLEASLERLLGMDFIFAERYVVVNIPAAFVEAVAQRQGRAPLSRHRRQDRQAVADADRLHHRGRSQPDLDGAAVDHQERDRRPICARIRAISAACTCGCSAAHDRGDQSVVGRLVVRPLAQFHRAAGCRHLERARQCEDRHAESVFGLHARHRYAKAVRRRLPLRFPRLHARRQCARSRRLDSRRICRAGIAPRSTPASRRVRPGSSTCRTKCRSPGSISPAG